MTLTYGEIELLNDATRNLGPSTIQVTGNYSRLCNPEPGPISELQESG